jgi:hypothetical protein
MRRRWSLPDVLCRQPTRSYDVWHDRAVFHFLVEPGDHARYLDTASRAVPVGAALIIGTFAVGRPTRCSGLPTARYDPDTLGREFAPAFAREHSEAKQHITPSGGIQPFTWVVLRRVR